MTKSILQLHERALASFGARVHAIRPDQWDAATPCTEWSVRDLVSHLVVEQLWVPPLVRGATVAEIGDRFDGDQLGDDPVGAWDRAADAARETFAEPGAIERSVHLSYGDVPAAHYCREMSMDATVHSWDLARAIGADERLDPDLVDLAYEWAATHVEQLAGSGLFADPVDVPKGSDRQTLLLALLGRRP